MAARKPAAKPDSETEPETAVESAVDEVHVRGGWDVGYRGDRTDPAPDEAYTVAGVTAGSRPDGDEK